MGITQKPIVRAHNLTFKSGSYVEFHGPKFPWKFVCRWDESRDLYAFFGLHLILRVYYGLKSYAKNKKRSNH